MNVNNLFFCFVRTYGTAPTFVLGWDFGVKIVVVVVVGHFKNCFSGLVFTWKIFYNENREIFGGSQ